MSLEKPNSGPKDKQDAEKNTPERLNYVQPMSERITRNLGRRGFVTGAAALTAAGIGKLGAVKTTETLLPNSSAAASEKERELIQEQLTKYEAAQKKGVKSTVGEWLDNVKKGYEKHGLNFPAAMSEFSQEGLRLRVFKLDALASLYDVSNTVFFIGYTYMLFGPLKKAIGSYAQNKAEIAKDKKLEDFVNGLAERAERIETELARLNSAHSVSRPEFEKLTADIKELGTAMLNAPDKRALLTGPDAAETKNESDKDKVER